eukprot:CAMPEP_0196594554 /NCGR_PEP_ID=MMETSP1081-20130531/78679_1 /TAXON_ID=36882 /ORGANISM="Pyramimonas amylifera, Strain CCMP720" /LENGTH=116 /DNA_ID=CAMNT_0041918849 /DNA_START=140 /DNA_END=490 /DNA_ORIENTATION=-
MAAAALGNLISDIVGLGASGSIEASASRMGIEEPSMTHYQRIMPRVKLTRWAGSLLGVSLGCLLGMVPLLFFNSSSNMKDVHDMQVEISELEQKVKEMSEARGSSGGAEAAALNGT